MKDHRWLTISEISLLVGAGMGTAATAAAQNLLYVSAPLTVLAAVGVLSRQRLQRQVSQSCSTLAVQQEAATQRLNRLEQQVSTLPSLDALTQFRRSLLERNNKLLAQVYQELDGLKAQVQTCLKAEDLPDLSPVYQDIAQLQDQYTAVCTALESMTAYVNRFATIPRVEAIEVQIAQLKTEEMRIRVGLETLSTELRMTTHHLQDEMLNLDRRFHQPKSSVDPSLLKEEVEELVKSVADLVPRRDFISLSQRLQEMHERQVTLQSRLNEVRGVSESGLPHLNQERRGPSDPPLASEVAPLSGFERVSEKPKIGEPWTTSTPRASADALTILTQRLQQMESRLAELQATPANLPAAIELPDTPQTHWIVDFPQLSSTSPEAAGRQLLERVLEQAQHRLLLVWPWSAAVMLDASMTAQFQQLLDRGCQLEIGWCHRGDAQTGRFLRVINQQWESEATSIRELKASLNRLLPLRQQYPDQFKFKLLGTDEGFLVCDRSFAILTLETLPIRSQAFPEAELKLKTTIPSVVEGLIERFENPTLAADDVTAYFNRATTRYDLRDIAGAVLDFNQVISLAPDHGVALNNRGIALQELGHSQAAEADFTRALHNQPDLFAAYCNRGWLRLDQGRYEAAIRDFSNALKQQPHRPMAYIYRGSAFQKQGNLAAALENYTAAIAHCEAPLPLPYFYRSVVYQKQGDAHQAIADLETAQAYLRTQGDSSLLAAVQQALAKLKSNTLQEHIESNGRTIVTAH